MGKFSRNFIESEFLSVHQLHTRRILGEFQKIPSGQISMGGKSFTTSFALLYDKGVLMASDRRMVGGYGLDILSDEEVKIKQVSPFSGLSFAGLAALCQLFSRCLESVNERFFDRFGAWLSPEGHVNYLKSILAEIAYFLLLVPEANTESLLAFYDQEKEKGRIFSLSIATPYSSFSQEIFGFCGTGCGYTTIQSLLRHFYLQHRSKYGKLLNLRKATELATLAIYHSGLSSIGVSDSRFVLPSVAKIDRNGFKFIPDSILIPHRDKILREFEGIEVKEVKNDKK